MSTPSEHSELKDAPTLSGLSRTDPFVVPDGFFDRFPTAMSERIAGPHARVTDAGPWNLLSVRRYRVLGIAASVIALAIATFFFLPDRTGTTDTALAEITLTPTELDAQELDETELLAMMDEGTSLLGDGLSTDEMAQYLDNEELSLDLLIEEL